MNPTKTKPTALFVAVLLFAVPAHANEAAGVVLNHDADAGTVEVHVRGEHFTTYHYGAHHARTPFLWPVLAEGGVGVTRNHPMGEDVPPSTDHPHHRSLFLAAVVNGHDFFHARRGERVDPVEVTVGEGDGYGWIRAHHRWRGRDGTILLDELQEWRFHDTPASARYIDLATTFKATRADISFRDSTKYAFLAVRVRPEIEGRHGGVITNARGHQGADRVFGAASPWVDYSGLIEGHGQRGIALFDHPANFREPFIFVRDYGLAMFNPFGNGRPRDAESYTVAKGASRTLRYRIYVHSGDVNEVDVAGHYARYIDDSK